MHDFVEYDSETFDFYGYIVKIMCNDTLLLSQVKYIYRDYTVHLNLSYHYIYLVQNNSTQELIVSNLMDDEKISVYHGKLLSTLELWREATTFLPPITAPYFREAFSFYHGCAIRYNNQTIVFFGASRSGKSTMLMKLLDRGGEIISDDLVVIRNSDYKVLPFKKPIGIRDTNEFFTDPRVLLAVENKPRCIPTFYVEKLKLTTELIHVTEIEGWSYYDFDSKVDKIYIINNDEQTSEMTIVQYIEVLREQACISSNSISVLLEIYKRLGYVPKSINLRNDELVEI